MIVNLGKLLLACLLCVLMGGCVASQTYSPDQAPEYMILADFTPFYRLGPMQARGPDATLRSQTRVKLLRKEMGYSLIQMEDTRTGYVPNESLIIAPPRPPEPKPSILSDDSSSGGRKKNRGASSPVYRGEQLNDIPLPDPGIPPPDLNIFPEDVAPAPTPSAPAEKPKFRL